MYLYFKLVYHFKLKFYNGSILVFSCAVIIMKPIHSKFPYANNSYKQKTLYKIGCSGWQNNYVNNSSHIFTNKMNISSSRFDII